MTSNPSNATTVNYDVTVATGTNEYGSGNKYYIDGVLSPTLQLMAGVTYRFKQDSNTNSNHPLRFSTTPNGTHAGGAEYTTGVTTNGVPGESGSYTEITPTVTTPRLFAYCINHSGMGFQASANGGLHVLTGQDALKGISEVGAAVSYAVTGFDAQFEIKLAADNGTFTLAGQDALKDISELAAAVTYTLTGIDAVFAIQVTMIVDSAGFTLTGQDAEFKFIFNRAEFAGAKNSAIITDKNQAVLSSTSVNSVELGDENTATVTTLSPNDATLNYNLNEAA